MSGWVERRNFFQEAGAAWSQVQRHEVGAVSEATGGQVECSLGDEMTTEKLRSFQNANNLIFGTEELVHPRSESYRQQFQGYICACALVTMMQHIDNFV